MAISTTLPEAPALEPSSTTILVTGANGFVASHIIFEALRLGYHVRGTARTAEKAQATEELFQHNPLYSTAVVSDFASAIPEIEAAVKGVDSIIHVASDMSKSPDPQQVIPPVVESTLNVLRAAKKESSVKRFTLTSSSVAVVGQQFGGTPESVVTAKTWADGMVEMAWKKPGPDGWPAEQPLYVYGASKVEGEKAFWKFVKEEQPAFVANAVLPNLLVGGLIPGDSPGGSWYFVPWVYQKQEYPPLPSMHFINTTDAARLHLAAAVLDSSLSNQRIFGFADEFNWNDIADMIERVRPDLKMNVTRNPNLGRDLTKVPKEQSVGLLKRWFGQDGYKSLEESVRENMQGVE